MTTLDWSFYAAAFPATMLLGLSKGGFTGLSVLAQPILALAISPVRAAAILLPVLIVQDVVSLAAYWRRWDNRQLNLLLPGAFLGVIAGYLLASSISDATIEAGIGVLALIEATRHALKRGADSSVAAARPGRFAGRLWSLLSGFTSMIANAGGPPFMIYLLRQDLSRDVFAATAVAFFAIVNWIKLPFFMALGQITSSNLTTSAVLFPIAVVSTLAGVRLVTLVPQERYFGVIYGLLAAVGAKLLYDGITIT
ncbi:sulfite exporter TauE/SafE family protein [Beijerinckia mobilis]|uniref:sulfite exporter TauE/SafE family protein n=1 Tax=Beijerinckia mobilis TaxID=231434 RepID=UPI001FDA40C2|nr:sulfite exporter TauE/SafE family protein [Beijerinckia mobilis]